MRSVSTQDVQNLQTALRKLSHLEYFYPASWHEASSVPQGGPSLYYALRSMEREIWYEKSHVYLMRVFHAAKAEIWLILVSAQLAMKTEVENRPVSDRPLSRIRNGWFGVTCFAYASMRVHVIQNGMLWVNFIVLSNLITNARRGIEGLNPQWVPWLCSRYKNSVYSHKASKFL